MNTSIQRRSTRTRKPLLMKANEQYCLDFGQKNIDPVRCHTCGMMYVVGEESDEKQHAKYHAELNEGVRWSVKLERPKRYYDDGGRIVAIIPEDPKPVLEAINKVLKMSDSDMSTGEDVLKLLSNTETIFHIYINTTNHIIGYICAEQIKEARHLVNFETSQMEEEPVPAECGVLYLWVHPNYRKQGIGTRLTDTARANLYKSKIVFRSRVAVCDPTEAAIPFFNGYLKMKRPVKVYQQS